jgi:hypothetical protein
MVPKKIPVGVRFSLPVQTGPGTHPACCIMGTGSFPGIESGRGVTLTPYPHLVPRSKNSILLLSLRAFVACKKGETCLHTYRGPSSSVGIVRASNPGGVEIFRTSPDQAWGPPSLLYNGYRVFSRGRNRPGRDADPLPPSSAEV